MGEGVYGSPLHVTASAGVIKMDIKTLKEITKLMKDNDLVEVEVESGGHAPGRAA